MPIPQSFKISLLDLDKNRAIGVSIPFNGKGVFNKTYDTKTQLKSNLFNLILTNQGERLFNPLFGSDVRKYLFEGLNPNALEKIEENIRSSVEVYIPQVLINTVDVTSTPDSNKLEIYIDYSIVISNATDSLQINFE